MKRSFLIVLSCVLSQVLAYKDRCTPGSIFIANDGCNYCRCPTNGVKSVAACTKMACAGQCTPNTSFTAADGCNQCYCPASGLISDAACTERLCIPSEDRCTPGETFMATDGCNRCICPANGLAWGAACTLMACIVEPSILVDPIPISLIPISTTL